jgi:hypothetical protein
VAQPDHLVTWPAGPTPHKRHSKASAGVSIHPVDKKFKNKQTKSPEGIKKRTHLLTGMTQPVELRAVDFDLFANIRQVKCHRLVVNNVHDPAAIPMAVDVSGADQADSLLVRLIQLLKQKRRVGEMIVQLPSQVDVSLLSLVNLDVKFSGRI